MSENDFREGNESFFKDLDAIFENYRELKNNKDTSELLLEKVYEESMEKMFELVREYFNSESKFEVARVKAYFERYGLNWSESVADKVRWSIKEYNRLAIDEAAEEDENEDDEE